MAVAGMLETIFSRAAILDSKLDPPERDISETSAKGSCS